jgi:hypothetical protein
MAEGNKHASLQYGNVNHATKSFIVLIMLKNFLFVILDITNKLGCLGLKSMFYIHNFRVLGIPLPWVGSCLNRDCGKLA